jgi:hypothetical protein
MSEKPEDSLGKEMKQFIQDEIRRASDLPQDKLLLLFEPLIAPIPRLRVCSAAPWISPRQPAPAILARHR